MNMYLTNHLAVADWYSRCGTDIADNAIADYLNLSL